VPPISIHDYLVRLTRHAILTPPLLLSTVYYMDRLSALYPRFTMDSWTAHRFLITAVTVAAKCLSDQCCTTTHYARIGGVSGAELRLLQRELLSRVGSRTVPDPELLLTYYHGLVDRSDRFGLANTNRPAMVPQTMRRWGNRGSFRQKDEVRHPRMTTSNSTFAALSLFEAPSSRWIF
jgi:hypothetical protein